MSLTEDDRSRASAVEDDGEVQDNRSGSGHWENEWDHLSDWEKMHSLVRENKIDELENWKAHLAKTDENKENLFHSAAYDGNEETCAYLFDNGLNDIDRKNRLKPIPIQIACARNNSAALEFLLDKKANIDVKVVRRAGYAPPIIPIISEEDPHSISEDSIPISDSKISMMNIPSIMDMNISMMIEHIEIDMENPMAIICFIFAFAMKL